MNVSSLAITLLTFLFLLDCSNTKYLLVNIDENTIGNFRNKAIWTEHFQLLLHSEQVRGDLTKMNLPKGDPTKGRLAKKVQAKETPANRIPARERRLRLKKVRY